ncbi:hexamethylene bisacetamide inducible [Lycorma delicatula]|uniref:hexamethylene bisacetamide inducible n=1 Tax=Lycorma delicatula TaxID=130591 RepID=UPI003F5163D3
MSAEQNSDVTKRNDNLRRNMTDRGDVKCLEQINFSALPSGADNHNCNLKQTAKDFDGDHCERKKKTRRGKPKRKKPYNKEVTVTRVKNYPKSRTNNCSRFRNRQPVAPNNTNQFLMEDHKDLQLKELDERLQATANKANEANAASNFGNLNRPPRVRDSSFTSADSDEDYFYSSPEDEEEFLTKEFSNTYQDLHAESLQSMSKPELIQHVLHLETKIDILEQRLGSQNEPELKEIVNDRGENDRKLVDKGKTAADYEKEIEKLKLLNEQLMAENERLQRQNRSSSVSSVDSESDSSSSSDSSASSASGSDNEVKYEEVDENIDDLNEPNLNNGLMVPQGICSMESEDVT